MFGIRAEAVLLKYLGKASKDIPILKLDERTRELGLDIFLPEEMWPAPSALREIIKQVAFLKKRGVDNPFIVAELRKCVCAMSSVCACVLLNLCRFLPKGCPEFTSVYEGTENEASAEVKGRNSKNPRR